MSARPNLTPEQLNDFLARYMGADHWIDGVGEVLYEAGGDWYETPPPYASDLDLMHTVEARLLAECYEEQYGQALHRICGGEALCNNAGELFYAAVADLVHATAEQKARAAVAVLAGRTDE